MFLKKELSQIGWPIQEINPFDQEPSEISYQAFQSPYAARVHALWGRFRPIVLKHFPKAPKISSDINKALEKITEVYVQDAYNSLSIEGYQVTEGLIQKVEQAKWRPDLDMSDRGQYNALAARGYYESFLEVKKTVEKILEGGKAGELVAHDLQKWYQKLFHPMVQAGILSASDLFGYRRQQVYIRSSRHLPPAKEYLTDAMDALFQLFKEEEHAAVRAVLGHFIFVFIHPFMDGNGRIGRFLMNVMLVSGGYPWTIIRVSNREQYMEALERASVDGDILPFVQFIVSEMNLILW